MDKLPAILATIKHALHVRIDKSPVPVTEEFRNKEFIYLHRYTDSGSSSSLVFQIKLMVTFYQSTIYSISKTKAL